mmetsp:Transcript_6497/g.14213  ORF Transcript_6497/g.14213 Transcript_6497/m.14213 type:complete len:130 (-) Transcript_6497:553-942(-)
MESAILASAFAMKAGLVTTVAKCNHPSRAPTTAVAMEFANEGDAYATSFMMAHLAHTAVAAPTAAPARVDVSVGVASARMGQPVMIVHNPLTRAQTPVEEPSAGCVSTEAAAVFLASVDLHVNCRPPPA